jgi:hypothetical protein
MEGDYYPGGKAEGEGVMEQVSARLTLAICYPNS